MISIIIPCYNDEMRLQRAVNSALRQDYKDPYEIVVVDDGSKKTIENRWGDRVNLIHHPENLGLPIALNTGIRECKGDRFLILASDDKLHPVYLSSMSKSGADIVSCDFMGENQK